MKATPALLVRLALRSIRSAPKRSALIIALLALPVLAGTAAAMINRTVTPSAQEQLESQYGRADRVVVFQNATDASGLVRSVDESGDEVSAVVLRRSVARLCATCYAEVFGTDLKNPILSSMFSVVDGTMPRAAHEAAMSARLFDELELELGDAWTPPGADRSVEISAVVERPARGGAYVVLSQSSYEAWASSDASSVSGSRDVLLMGDPVVLDHLLETHEVDVLSVFVLAVENFERFQDGYLDPVTRPSQLSTIVTAAAAIEIALLAAVAFAVGTRRRIVEFGQFTVIGAEPAAIRTMVLVEAALLGVVGVAVGALVAVAVVALGSPLGWFSVFGDRAATTLRWSLFDLVGPAVIALGAALVAAWLPARTVARVPALTALAGRVPSRRTPRAIPVLGICAVVFGAILLLGQVTSTSTSAGGDREAAVSVFAVLLLFAGFVSFAAPLLGLLARLGTRLPAVPRLAVRGSARQRSRSAASVAAFVALAAVPVFATAVLRNDPGEVSQPANTIMFIADSTIGTDGVATTIEPERFLAQADALEAELSKSIDIVGRRELRATVVFEAAQDLTDGDRVAAFEAAWVVEQSVDHQDRGLVGYVLAPPPPATFTIEMWIILGVAGVLSLLVALIAASLSAVELDKELSTMIAVGGSPSLRRRIIGVESWYHLTLGGLLGVPLGLLMVWIVERDDIDFAFPAEAVLFGLVVGPVLVGLLVSALFRSGSPAVSRRLS